MLSSTHHRLAGIGAFALSGVIAVTAFFAWIGQESLSDMAVRLPGNDGRPATVRAEDGPVDFTGVFH